MSGLLLAMLLCRTVGIALGLPEVTLHSTHTTQSCSKFFSMPGQDVTTIVFEISGNGSDNFNDARFHYETALGAELQARPLLRAKGGCIEPKPPPAPADGSYCEQINPFLYHVTFIKTADRASSRGDAYVKWVYKNNNNKMVTTSAHFALPDVRDNVDLCLELNKCKQPISNMGVNSDHQSIHIKIELEDKELFNKVCEEVVPLKDCIKENMGSCTASDARKKIFRFLNELFTICYGDQMNKPALTKPKEPSGLVDEKPKGIFNGDGFDKPAPNFFDFGDACHICCIGQAEGIWCVAVIAVVIVQSILVICVCSLYYCNCCKKKTEGKDKVLSSNRRPSEKL